MLKIPPYSQITKTLSPSEKVGQLFMPAAFINDSEEEIRRLESLIRRANIGGLCFFHSRASAATNFEGPREVVYNANSLQTLKKLIIRYQEAASIPLLISMDAEWGLAMRIENCRQFAYAITLGAIREQDDLIEEVGRDIALDCLQAGIHWNFAPVADINQNPDNPVIGYRSFGENREKVSNKAISYMKGMQSMGLLSCAKHFPGHGDTATDSHLGLPVIQKNLNDLKFNELYPFKQMIREGVDAVMVGHLAVPALTPGKTESASVSKSIIQELLRQHLGFTGAVVSDALNMHSVSRLFPEAGQLEWEAFNAGNDILCFAENLEEGIKAILNKSTKSRIEASFKRLWNLKQKAMSHPFSGTLETTTQVPLLKRLAQASLTLLKGKEAVFDEFRRNPFTLWEVTTSPGQVFPNLLVKECEAAIKHLMQPTEMNPTLPDAQGRRILIALYPPSIKPPNNFGHSKQVLTFLNQLIRKNEVLLYNFGNPYVMDSLDMARVKAVVQVYQDFPVFQENAAAHFLGRSKAEGVLPITLKNSPYENV